ncbi:MAG: hypothetical protein IJU70_11700, partial [Lentisphaeria bacterium]|nr:hypothetical protein [Lentisphaeria bacterium]
MIVPMKKITLLAVAAEEDKVLSELRGLGVMQIEMTGAVSGTSSGLADRLAGTRRVLAALEERRPATPGRSSSLAGETVCKDAAERLEKLSRTETELDSLNQRKKALAMWGDFDRSLL